MNVTQTKLDGCVIIEPRVFGDDRGFFLETYNLERYRDAGIALPFVQDNHSRSSRGILRGLHYQIKHPQGKLVWATRGEVFDVAVDLRKASPTFGQWVGVHLSDQNHRQLWVPPGFAHGFVALSDVVDFVYKCTDVYAPEHERTIRFDDPELGIEWPIDVPLLSDKDRNGLAFADAPYFP